MILKVKRKNNVLFYTLLTVLLGLIFIRYVFQIGFPRQVLLAVAILIVMWGDKDSIIALSVCCIPLYTSMQYTFAICVGLMVYCYKYGEDIKIDLSFLLLLAIMIWELMHGFNGPFSPVHYLGTMVPFVLCAVLMYDRAYKADYFFIVQAFALATLAICVVLLSKVVVSSGFNVIRALADLRRLGIDEEATAVVGAELNPNTLGILCVLAITGLLQSRMFHRKSIFNDVQILILLLFGVMTSSRTFLACLAIMAILFFFAQKGSIFKKLQFLVMLVAIGAAALFLLHLFFPDLLEYYFGRFQVEDISSGRTTIFQAYNQFILSSPRVQFFGLGVIDFADKVMNQYKVTINIPHNGVQELIVAWGLPGLLLFGAFFLVLLLNARQKSGRQGLVNYIPLLVLMAKIQVGQMLTSTYTMLAFSLVYLSLIHNFEITSQEA